MIKARHTLFHDWFFKQYSRIMIHRHFHDVVIKGAPALEDKAVLLIGNHFSWWDGFIAKYLNDNYFNRIFHVMMLENELKQRMFLNKAGAYSILKNSKSMLASIDYTIELLQHKNNLVAFYPQGKFFSIYHQPIVFEPGMLKYLFKSKPELQLVFYVALVDYFEHVKPTLTIGLMKYEGKSFDADATEVAFNDFFQTMVAAQPKV